MRKQKIIILGNCVIVRVKYGKYLVGSDANSLIEKRKSVPERKFLEFMSQNILGSETH